MNLKNIIKNSFIIFSFSIIFMFISCLYIVDVSANGFIQSDYTTSYGGITKYAYSLPQRYSGYAENNDNQAYKFIFNSNDQLKQYGHLKVYNNQYVYDKFKDVMPNNPYRNNIVSTNFYFNYMYNSYISSSSGNHVFKFQAGIPDNLEETQFTNPLYIKKDGRYDFEIDMYLENINQNKMTWFKLNSAGYETTVLYENGGYNDIGYCNASLVDSSLIDSDHQPKLALYHLRCHNVMMYDSLHDSNSLQVNANTSYNDVLQFKDSLYSGWTMGCWNSNNSCNLQLNVWISAPYNIYYLSTNSAIWLNGDRITNTDDINYASSNTCYDEHCDGSGNLGDGIDYDWIEQFMNTEVFDDYGLGTFLNSIKNLYNKIFNSNIHNCYTLNIPVLDTNIVMPCGSSFWYRQDMNNFRATYELVFGAIIYLSVGLAFYKKILQIFNPDNINTDIEVNTL